MKIYLLSPPSTPRFIRSARWEAADRGGTTYYPLWLSYTTGVLEERYKEVRLVDAQVWGWSVDDVVNDVKKFNPDLVVVDCAFSSLMSDIKVAETIKKNIKKDVKTVLVGPPTSQFSEKILNNDVDIVARFEYDFTIRDIAEAVEEGKSLENIKGISYKEDGKIIHNPDRGFTNSEELDAIPFVSKVYKNHLNIKDYFLAHTLYPMVQIFTGRGCPNQCTFCSWPKTLMGRKYRVRSVENVVDEFEYIAEEIPEVKEIFIEDDTFTIDRKRVKEICEEIIKRKLDVTWSCNARADLDYETMKAMKEAGCRLLDVGYESGNDNILKNIKKGITLDQARDFTKNAKKAGLMILADFVIGLPGETKETVEKTIKFVKELKPELMQFSVATPIPGTEFYDWVKENNFLIVDDLEESLNDEGIQKAIISYPELTNEEIEKYVQKGVKDYYLSPSYIPIAMKSILRKNGLSELRRMMISVKMFFNYLRKGR